jgi:hypothetical protein
MDIQGAVKEQGKVFELQRVILAAHQSALAAQEAQATLLQRVRELEEQVRGFEAWDGEKDSYNMMDVNRGRGSVLIYGLKKDASGTEPFHALCAKCYNHKIKSVIQATYRIERAQLPARLPSSAILVRNIRGAT